MPRRNSSQEIEVLGRLSQQAAAWLVGMKPRSLRDTDAPRDKEGLYDGAALIQWLRERDGVDAGEGVTVKAQIEAVKLEKEKGELELLRRDLAERDRDFIPAHEINTIYWGLRTLSLDASKRAEKAWGADGKDFYAELWRSFARHFANLVDGEKEYILCTRSRRGKLTPIA